MRAIMLTTLLSLSLASAAASAGTIAGKHFPDAAKVGGKTLQLNGMGLRLATFLDIKVYAAGLYVAQRSHDPGVLLKDGPKRIVMQFMRDISKKQLIGGWEEGFKKNAAGQAKAELAQFNALMTDVHDGDTLVFTYVPGQGTEVKIAGKKRGTVKGAAFAKALFSVWLGPKPPNKELKKGLLGG